MLVGLGLLLALSLAVSAALDALIDWVAPGHRRCGNAVPRWTGPVLEFVVNCVLAAACSPRCRGCGSARAGCCRPR